MSGDVFMEGYLTAERMVDAGRRGPSGVAIDHAASGAGGRSGGGTRRDATGSVADGWAMSAVVIGCAIGTIGSAQQEWACAMEQ
jgi:hypothetical protein